MPFGFVFKCDNCRAEILVSGLWEYYVDKHGCRQRYGHPGPNSNQAKKAGVKGFTFQGYCPTCREVHEAIVIEFVEPQSGSLGACLAYSNSDVQHKEFAPGCDKCGTTLPDALEGEPCPKCNAGHFIEESRFMS